MKRDKQVTPEAVMAALSQVEDPELHRDLVSLGMIKDLNVSDGKVAFSLELTTPACPLRTQIERDAREAVMALDGVDEVQLNMTAKVPSDGRPRDIASHAIRNVVAVGSGKGGVGKTTIAVNLAVALAQAGARVGLLDADMYGPNVPTMMGVDKMPPVSDGKMTPAEAFGVRLMSLAFLIPPDQPLIWRGPMLHSAIRQFFVDVSWGELDYLIVDLPPGTGDTPLSLTQTITLSGAIVVTMPQKVSLEDARRGLEMFKTLDVPVLGVVENMSYLQLPDGNQLDIFGQGGGQDLADETGTPFLGSIPIDPNLRQAGDVGVPFVISHPDTPAGRALLDVSEAVAAKISVSALSKAESAPD